MMYTISQKSLTDNIVFTKTAFGQNRGKKQENGEERRRRTGTKGGEEGGGVGHGYMYH